MHYTIKTPAIHGDVVPLCFLAESMAGPYGTANGTTPFNQRRFSFNLRAIIKSFMVEARAGRLRVCSRIGFSGAVDDIIEAVKNEQGLSESMQYVTDPTTGIETDQLETDWDTTFLYCLYAKLNHLNEWGASKGDTFSISHEGVEWVEVWDNNQGKSDVFVYGKVTTAEQSPVLHAAVPPVMQESNEQLLLDPIPFAKACKILHERFKATGAELAMWIFQQDLRAWCSTTKSGKVMPTGRFQFSASESSNSADAAAQMLATWNVLLSESEVTNFSPTERYLGYETALKRIGNFAKSNSDAKAMQIEWERIHNEVSRSKIYGNIQPKVAAYIPGGFAEKIEDGLFLERELDAFLRLNISMEDMEWFNSNHELAERMRQQEEDHYARGFYSLEQAADLLAAEVGVHRNQLLENMRRAVKNKQLDVRDPLTHLVENEPEKIKLNERVTRDDINRWLENTRAPYSFKGPEITTLKPAKASPVSPVAALPEAWLVKSVKLANEIGLRRFNSGERQITARNICDAVATELAKGEPGKPQMYHGNQGPRSADAIRSMALKGWKFEYPSGTHGINGTGEIS